MATMQRDGFAGYASGKLTTAPVLVSGSALQVSVAGGSRGVRVGVVGDADLTIENCDPIMGEQTDATVTWNGTQGLLSKYMNGAVALQFDIPTDAVAFAFRI